MSSGKFYVIGTPIGNLKDISLRAIETLNNLQTLVCEDSRVTSQLLHLLGEQGLIHNKPKLIVCNEFNEARVAPLIVEMVATGENIGLVSDAGMPALSDPGYRVIRGCYDQKIPVEVIPGVSALSTAMVMAGVGGEQVLYVGFLPKKAGKREQLLLLIKEMLMKTPSLRVVVFVSPHKIIRELSEIRETVGNQPCVLLREMTKKFEERIESNIDHMLTVYEKRTPKGEMVLIISN